MPTKTKSAQIVIIEYMDGHPHSVVTEYICDKFDGTTYQRYEFYDINWCKRDKTLYWHKSGGGPAHPMMTYEDSVFWAADHVVFGKYNMTTNDYTEIDKPLGRRLKRPLGKKKLEAAILNEDWSQPGIDGDASVEYCPECDDYLPSEGETELCDHVWYCDERGDWSKPGERCDWDCQECQEHERETADLPPWQKISQGYGAAASHFGSLVRAIMEKRNWTPASLAKEHWAGCSVAKQAIETAMRGETNGIREHELFEAMSELDLSDDERCDLMIAFLEEKKGDDDDD